MEVGDEIFYGGVGILDETVFDTGSEECGFGDIVFIFADAPVKFGVFFIGNDTAWEILLHERKDDFAGLEIFGDEFDNVEGIFQLSGEDEVAYDDTFLHNAVIIDDKLSGLSDHFADSVYGDVEIIWGVAVFCGGFGVSVFEIRQIDIDFIFKKFQSFWQFVTVAVIDDWHGEFFGKGICDGVCEVSGGDEIDIVSTEVDQAMVKSVELIGVQCDAGRFVAYAVILAVYAMQIAAGKEYCTAAA